MEEQLKMFKESLNLEVEIEDVKNDKMEDLQVEFDEFWYGFDFDKDDGDNDNNESSVKFILKKGVITEIYDDLIIVELEILEFNDNFEYLVQLNNVKLEKVEKVFK